MVAAGVVLVGLWAAVHPGRKVMTVAGRAALLFCLPLAYVILGFYLERMWPDLRAHRHRAVRPGGDGRDVPYYHFRHADDGAGVDDGADLTGQASGSIELLMTNPVRDVEWSMGKYVAAVALFGIVLVATLGVPADPEKFGEPDWGAILAGYIGVLLAGMAAHRRRPVRQLAHLQPDRLRSWARSCCCFSGLSAGWAMRSAGVGDVARYLSVYENFQDFAKGIIDTRPLVFFASLTFFALMLTVRTLGESPPGLSAPSHHPAQAFGQVTPMSDEHKQPDTTRGRRPDRSAADPAGAPPQHGRVGGGGAGWERGTAPGGAAVLDGHQSQLLPRPQRSSWE